VAGPVKRMRSRPRTELVALVLGCVLTACTSGGPSAGGTRPSSVPNAGSPSPFALSSTDLSSGRWPSADTCDGGDGVPDLHWTAGPVGTRAYALQLFDPDAPNGGFAHWMLANEPAELRGPTPGTGMSGKNDFGLEGYRGPCPPHGSNHHYVFMVYALDSVLGLHLLFTREDFQGALRGHILAQAELTATYSR
jgi:Raf kinase inhibitor-like YbhB/YbcL family protein